jgi:hypothetical protein
MMMEPKATHGLPSLSQGFLLYEQAAIRLFLAWYRLGKSSEAQAKRDVRFCRRQRSADRLPLRVSGTRGTERTFYAVERSRLSPQAGAGKRDSLNAWRI